MKDFVLFLHGTYRPKELGFYKKLARGKTRVAVDGGLAFFAKSGLKPDIVIGDLDSARNTPRALLHKARVMAFPAKKDKTDVHLALEHCLEMGARSVDIVMPSVGEADHYLGTIMLLTLSDFADVSRRQCKLRIVSAGCEVFFLQDTRMSLSNCPGDMISVIPISRHISLTCTGCEYPVTNLRVKRGHSRSLRNRITKKRALFSVKGEALLIHKQAE